MSWWILGGTTHGAVADDSKELLRQLRIVTQRDGLANDRDLTDIKAYFWLTQGQKALARTLITHLPELMKSAPEKMTSADGGVTYSTTDEPLSHVEVYEAPSCEEPLGEGPLWSMSADFSREGPKTIRMQGNRARVFADGPYARYVKKPGIIDDVQNPTLLPSEARHFICWKAAHLWAQSGNGYDPTPYARMLQTLLWGDPDSPGDIGFIPAYKHQYSSPGGSSPLWWRGMGSYG